jgi:hypothetical protein
MDNKPKVIDIDPGTLLFITIAVLLVPLLLSGFLWH